MNLSLVIFASVCFTTVFATGDLFVGSWKEDQTQRQNLGDYLYYRGLSWFKRVYATSASFELTADITKEGNTYTVTGKKGPRYEDYQFNLIPDGQSRTDIDLGVLGGPRKATAELKGNSLMTYLHKMDASDEVDVIAIRTIDPATPNVMTYTLKDVPSGTNLIQVLRRQ